MSMQRLAQSRFGNDAPALGLFQAFTAGASIYYQGHIISSQAQLLAIEDYSQVFIEENQKQTSAKTHVARNEHQALLFPFYETLEQIECPNCNTKMNPIHLANDVKALYCPSCRHCDYDPRVKNSIKAGEPSKERLLDLEQTDNGNCRIKP
jgi:hypothetical protein